MKVSDLDTTLRSYRDQNGAEERYSSFDYCYGFFRNTPPRKLIDDMEKSCLAIGFYLASWGMLRGSSFLLQKSARYYIPLIEFISEQDSSLWEIDVDSYSEENVVMLIKVYDSIREILVPQKKSHLTLTTKIMMGVFGNVPAYDQYFCDTMRELSGSGFRSFNETSLKAISDFYQTNRGAINKYHRSIRVRGFTSGKLTELRYPRAKIIDMYGFTKGIEKNQPRPPKG